MNGNSHWNHTGTWVEIDESFKPHKSKFQAHGKSQNLKPNPWGNSNKSLLDLKISYIKYKSRQITELKSS
jgi:hypothetical protein